MKNVQLIIIFNLVFGALFGQNYSKYYKLCNEADKEIYFKKYKSALGKLEEAFATVDYVHAFQYKKASTCAIKIKDFRKGFLYIKKSIINGNKDPYWKNKTLKEFKTSKYYQPLQDSAGYFEQEHLKTINLEYKKIIDSLYFIDQYVIRKSKQAKGNYQIDRSALPENLFDLDSLNLRTLLASIEKYGFPSEQNIGVDGYEKASIIIHHNFRLEQNEIHHPLIIAAVFSGKYLPTDFEGMYEQYNIWYKGQTFFTTWDKNLSEVNLERINSNRLKYGLKELDAYKIKKKGLVMKRIW